MADLVSQSKGVKGKKIFAWEDKIVDFPDSYVAMTPAQLSMYEEYLEYVLTEKERKWCHIYVFDDEKSSNKRQTTAEVYSQDLRTKAGRDTTNRLSYDVSRRDRVIKYVELLRYKHGQSLREAIPLVNQRLKQFADSGDKQLALQAIKEINRIVGRTTDGANIQINAGGQTEVFHWQNLTDDELETYNRLLDKLKQDPNEIQVIE